MINNVISLPSALNKMTEVMVMKPSELAEMPLVIQALLEQKPVVLNLTLMEPEQAQRAVDFVAGGTYSIEGELVRIGKGVFLFTPSGVQLTMMN